MAWVTENILDIFAIISMAIATCAAIAALTPTPKDDAALRKVRRIVDFIGLNFLHAENSKKDGPFRY